MNVTSITFERVKDALGIKKDTELASFLEVLPQQIAQAKKRDTIPYSKIIEKAALGKYRLDYIFLGVGEKSPLNESFNLEDKNALEDIVESKELAELLSDLIKYGNTDLYESIKERTQKIKEISRQYCLDIK